MELTPRQESVYKVILAYYRQHRFSPTVREIGEQLGLAGPAGIHRILKVLEARGYLSSTPGKNRSWRPVARELTPSLPVAGTIAAGEPLAVWDNPEERLPVDPTLYGHPDCFALRVAGDSMTGVHIQNNDLAIIRPQNDVASGEIAAVIVDGMLPEATLKFVNKKIGMVELKAANPDYPPLLFEGADREKIRIMGRYVGLIRQNRWGKQSGSLKKSGMRV